ncbi:MAG: hypothetical protein ACKOQP_00345 [Bacteroidota bacterium]
MLTYQLDRCILKSLRGWSGTGLLYQNPRFKNPGNRDYTLDTLSPAFRAGVDLRSLHPVLQWDLKGQPRSATPSLGCLERIEMGGIFVP